MTTFAYAEKIARDWNAVGQDEAAYGLVTEFEIPETPAEKYPVQFAGGKDHAELWVPAEDLDEFNAEIIGKIRVIAAYKDRAPYDLQQALSELKLDK